MTDRISFAYKKDRIRESSQLIITARFFEDAAADTPTNVHYRIDCLTSDRAILDWTSLSPDETVEITVTAEQNALHSSCNEYERRQITVAADYGLATQYQDCFGFDVINKSVMSLYSVS